MKFVWLYIAGGFLIAISVTFPLVLIARELGISRIESPRLGALDTIGLAAMAVVVAFPTAWVDVL